MARDIHAAEGLESHAAPAQLAHLPTATLVRNGSN